MLQRGGEERVNRQLSLSPADLSLAGAAWAGLSVSVLASCPLCPRQLSSLSWQAVLPVLISCPLCPRQLSSLSSPAVLVSCPSCPRQLSSSAVLSVLASCPLCPRKLSSNRDISLFFSLSYKRLLNKKNYLCRIKVKSCPAEWILVLSCLCRGRMQESNPGKSPKTSKRASFSGVASERYVSVIRQKESWRDKLFICGPVKSKIFSWFISTCRYWKSEIIFLYPQKMLFFRFHTNQIYGYNTIEQRFVLDNSLIYTGCGGLIRFFIYLILLKQRRSVLN